MRDEAVWLNGIVIEDGIKMERGLVEIQCALLYLQIGEIIWRFTSTPSHIAILYSKIPLKSIYSFRGTAITARLTKKSADPPRRQIQSLFKHTLRMDLDKWNSQYVLRH